jgi:hypothetical protein
MIDSIFLTKIARLAAPSLPKGGREPSAQELCLQLVMIEDVQQVLSRLGGVESQ